jgi:hypothetical protein
MATTLLRALGGTRPCPSSRRAWLALQASSSTSMLSTPCLSSSSSSSSCVPLPARRRRGDVSRMAVRSLCLSYRVRPQRWPWPQRRARAHRPKWWLWQGCLPSRRAQFFKFGHLCTSAFFVWRACAMRPRRLAQGSRQRPARSLVVRCRGKPCAEGTQTTRSKGDDAGKMLITGLRAGTMDVVINRGHSVSDHTPN